MRASNVIYETPEGRPFWKLRPLQILVTLVMVVLLALVRWRSCSPGPIVEAVAGPLGDRRHRGRRSGTSPSGRCCSAVVVLMFARALLRLAERQAARLQVGHAGQRGRARRLARSPRPRSRFYVANFGSYDKTYGALGGIVALLVWMWITNLALLFGIELNAERERSRELEAGVPRAEREIQLEPRDEPKDERTT